MPLIVLACGPGGQRLAQIDNQAPIGYPVMAIEVGKKVPALTLKNAQGAKVALNDFLGRDVVVFFYPKDDTPGCIKEACGFRDHWQEISDLNVEILGVSPDDGESHRQFSEKYNLPFTLLCDPSKAAMTRFDAYGEKNMYGKIIQGVIRSTVWIGADGKVKKHWRRVPKAADHPSKVLQAIQADRNAK